MTTPSTLDSPAPAAPQSGPHSGPRSGPPSGPRPGAPGPARIGACLRRARAALQWRLLLWWALLLLLPTLVAMLPVWQLLSDSLDYSPQAARLAQQLDLIAIADLAAIARERHLGALQGGMTVAVVLTLLVSPLLSAMTAAAAAAGVPSGAPVTDYPAARPGFGGLLAAGAAGYGRMLRMLVWAAVPFGLAAVLGGGAGHLADRVGETAVLQGDADLAGRLAQGALVLLMGLAHATLDTGRALLAVERHRRSAVLAWWAGCRLLLRRPLAVLGIYLAVTACGLLVAGVLLLVRLRVPALDTAGTLGAVVLGQLVVIVLGWMRAARLFALAALVTSTPSVATVPGR